MVPSVPRSVGLVCVLGLSLLGCDSGGDGVNGGSSAGLGGPHSLVGVDWQGDAFVVNGLQLQPSFRFETNSVTAKNVCEGTLEVTTSSPVRYRYTTTLPAASETTQSGDAFCTVEVAAGAVEFEVIGNEMTVAFGGQTTTFTSDGAVAGLYGTWAASAAEVGTLRWSIGDGSLKASLACENGLNAELSVAAAFTNLLDITQSTSNTASDGFGLDCDVASAGGHLRVHADLGSVHPDLERRARHLPPLSVAAVHVGPSARTIAREPAGSRAMTFVTGRADPAC